MGVEVSRQYRNLIVTFLVVILGTSCASVQPGKNKSDSLEAKSKKPVTHKIKSREASDYKAIEGYFKKNHHRALESKAKDFIRKYPGSPYLPSIENLRGLTFLRRKDPAQAIFHFQRAIDSNPAQGNFTQYVLYNLATAQFDANQIEDAQKTLERIHIDQIDQDNRLKVQYLKANIFTKKSNPLEAAKQLLVVGRWEEKFDSDDQKRAFHELLDLSLQKIGTQEELDDLFREFQDIPMADLLLFHLASKELARGNHELGLTHLKALTSGFPTSTYFRKAEELIASIDVSAPSQSRAIGVLLPLKGKFGKFGAKTLQGIQLSFGIFNPEVHDSDLALVVEDSGDEPEQAIQALERLALKHHVLAVIGPLLSKGLDEVTRRARELGVPMISLARRSTPIREFVFHGGLNQDIQAYEVARHATRKDLKKFAIVYPNDRTGLELAHSFWTAAETMGGQIVGIEAYEPGETDFRRIVDKLSGLYYDEARQREIDILVQEREANNIKKKTRKTEQYFRLKPVVDFDAVFIADDPKVAGQIIPTFAYRDIEKVKFLGTSSWNSNEFISRTQTYGENSFFVDAFFPGSEAPASRRFLEQYHSTFKQEPSAMEALAYDAAGLLQATVGSPGKTTLLSRGDLNSKLNKLQGYSGVTGTLSCKDGILFRNLQVLTVKSGHISAAD